MKVPCVKTCPDRSPTCHSECQDYKKYRKWLDKKNELERRNNVIEGYRSHQAIKQERRNRSKKYTGGEEE